MGTQARSTDGLLAALAMAMLLLASPLAATASSEKASIPDFVDESTARLPAASQSNVSAAAGDIDGDSDMDILAVAGNHTAGTGWDPSWRLQLLVNDGEGNFTDQTATRMSSATPNPAGSAAIFGDVDGDGDLDLFVANGATGGTLPGDFAGFQNALWINDGSGFFVDETESRLPAALDSSLDALFADIDGDADLDVFVATTTSIGTNAQNKLLVNDGDGVFSDESATRLPPRSAITLAAAAGDVDADGDIDIVAGNTSGQQTIILNNQGDGSFVAGATLPPADDVVVAELTGNDCPDVLLTGFSGSAVFAGSCDGAFTRSNESLPPTFSGVLGSSVADVDGDEDLDIFAAIPGSQQRLFLNDGAGGFSDGTAAHMPPLDVIARYPLFVDVDGDADPDLYVPVWYDGVGNQDRLLINQSESAGTKPCTIVGTSRDETLIGTPGDDVICGRGGNDRIYGLEGDDELRGGSGDDRIYGGLGADVIKGNEGNDRLLGGADDDRILGGPGADVIRGRGGNDRLDGNGGNDLLIGAKGNDNLNGGRGTDTCEGGLGSDSLRACEEQR